MIDLIEKLTEQVCKDHGLSMTNLAKNRILVPLNEMRAQVGLDIIPDFYVFGGGKEGDTSPPLKKQPQNVTVSLSECQDMIDVLVLAKVFKSKTQARKNYTRCLGLPEPGETIMVGKTKIKLVD